MRALVAEKEEACLMEAENWSVLTLNYLIEFTELSLLLDLKW